LDIGHNPVVSVIVPARNEEACLALCLESLVSQTEIDFEIIVVDDDSTDRTAEIARAFKGVGVGADVHVRPPLHVISAPDLPTNWTGKNNAMSAGAKIARGKWLLFTDADTVHRPGSLARAVAEAEQHGAALLSYSPEQEVRTFWEKAVMPVIFAELAATYPPKKVNDPASPIAAANGQYLLISREAYYAVGGHTKIANSLLEDVAMARLVKFSGRKIFFRYGGDAVRTRMYRSWGQMKEGWTKNLALLFPRSRALALVRGAEFVVVIGNLLAGLVAVLIKRFEVASLTLSLVFILAVWMWTRIRRAHFSFASNLLAFGGLAIFAHLLLRSATLHRNYGVSWKGRKYGSIQGKVPPKTENWSSYLSKSRVASESFMEGVEDSPVQKRGL
jgi:glycosyltransferase involved in cell wall biosynthesis